MIFLLRPFSSERTVNLCSAQIRELVQEEATRVGAQAFFSKPIDIDLFAQTITELLAGYE